MGTIRTSTDALVKAAAGGLLVAVAVAAIWRYSPEFQFYLCLLLGFGVAEVVAKFTNNKRGTDLQILSMVIVTVGLALSRLFLADRYGVQLQDINQLTPGIAAILQLRLIPDLLFAAIAFVIVWVRFR